MDEKIEINMEKFNKKINEWIDGNGELDRVVKDFCRISYKEGFNDAINEINEILKNSRN